MRPFMTAIEEEGMGNDVRMIAKGNKIIEMTVRKRVVLRDTFAWMGDSP